MRNIAVVLGIILILVLGGFLYMRAVSEQESSIATSTPPVDSNVPQTTVVAQNLDTPWAIVFLPDGSMLLTERPGRVRLINGSGQLESQPVAILNQVQEIGEGGLLGITIHPNFAANSYVYLYYTYSSSAGNTLNRVVRMTFENKQLEDEKIIVDRIPGASNHNGGRIKFGSDGFLYITTGDAENPSQAQDTSSLGGKILRVTDEGKPAPGNPFKNFVYSYGHRNPQGLAWDSNGELWETEHGPSGNQSGNDEINRITAGKNYGWPTIQGNQARSDMEIPIRSSGTTTTWAPAGAAFLDNSLFFGGLRGETLYEAVISGNQINLKEHFKGDFGRIREVILGPDNMPYITTSNQDGRGTPDSSDDKIIRVNPQKL